MKHGSLSKLTTTLNVYFFLCIYFICIAVLFSSHAAFAQSSELEDSLQSILNELNTLDPSEKDDTTALPLPESEDPLSDDAEPITTDEEEDDSVIIDSTLPVLPLDSTPLIESSDLTEEEEVGEEAEIVTEETTIAEPTIDSETEDAIIEQELSAPVGPFIQRPPPSSSAPTNTTPEIDTDIYTSYVQLEGLNKITARTSTLKTALKEPIIFGTLEIQVERCWKASPEKLPENKALIRIWEKIPGEFKKLIFYGWMFSSSPSLSALEHPVYDVTVTKCLETLE